MRKISIFGSTGSVGENTIKVIKAQDEDFDVQVLTANSNIEKLARQARAVNAKNVVIADANLYNDLKDLLADTNVKIHAGHDAICEAAMIPADWTMAAIVGMAGLNPLMQSIKQGKFVAIANKEPLVSAGPLVMQSADKYKATLLPVDSEHNAVFQVYEPSNFDAIERIILTASGGPFRQTPLSEMENITPKQALAHPNWTMGQKISIDSATMMNKALEVIEAKQLFKVQAGSIDVLVHPQSVVHSMIEYSDGSVLAQMGAADMCTPITNALGYPKRLKTPGEKLDLLKMNHLDFEAVDHQRFPVVQMAYDCLNDGLNSCIAFNASNEIAVEAFLSHKIAFLDIYKIIRNQLDCVESQSVKTLDEIQEYDQNVRTLTHDAIRNL